MTLFYISFFLASTLLGITSDPCDTPPPTPHNNHANKQDKQAEQAQAALSNPACFDCHQEQARQTA
jgi:hypothetical protein